MLILAVVAMTWLAPGGVQDFWRDLLLSSTGIGVVLSIVGLMLMLNGLIRALAGSGSVNPQRLGGMMGAVDRFVGAPTFVAGVAISAVGMAMLLAPGWLSLSLKRLLGLVP